MSLATLSEDDVVCHKEDKAMKNDKNAHKAIFDNRYGSQQSQSNAIQSSTWNNWNSKYPNYVKYAVREPRTVRYWREENNFVFEINSFPHPPTLNGKSAKHLAFQSMAEGVEVASMRINSYESIVIIS